MADPIRLPVDTDEGNVQLTVEEMRVVEAVSPTVTAERDADGVMITVHDLNGTRTAHVNDGENGETGNGIASTALNQDYTLSITFTDGTTWTSPMPIRGATGNGIASTTLNQDYTLSVTFTDGTTWTSPIPIRGATGATPDMSIGTVQTLPAGSQATAQISGTAEQPVLSLGIPKGDPGSVPIDDTAGAGDTTKVWSADKSAGEVSELKSAIDSMSTATLADEGKALKAKTVSNGKVTEWEFGEAGGGLTATQGNLLLTILGEGVYGSDQEANIELLRKALMDIAPVSISAVLESIPLVGLYYSDLEFTVTATFDDESTMVVDGYRITTAGAVVSGSNTVTIVYRGVTTDVTFVASSEQTYAVNYSLTDISASNKNYLIVAGERYETVLTADEGHYISSVIITMGGMDITSTAYTSMTQTIMIPEVTGDVSITAVADAYIYLGDLLFTREGGFSNCNGYPNESTGESKIIGGNYYYTPFVTEYPALHDCVVHWKITNVTENDLALDNCGFGSLDTYGNNIYGASSGVINAFNCVKADNLSHKLTAGESLEGDVSVKTGWSLCFICKYEDFASFGIELVGSYEQNTFDGYAEIVPTKATAPNFGTYRSVNYYSDDGNTLIKTHAGYPAAIKTNIEPGTYDVYYKMKAEVVPTDNRFRNVLAIFGGMKQNTDTDVYFAGGSDFATGYNIWFHTQFVITENDITLVAAIQYIDILTANDPKLSILYKKVVTE